MPIVLFLLFLIIIAIGSIVGWVANIVQLVHLPADPLTALFVIKAVGILVAPLGVVLGYIGFF
jgi:hypothetical protein